MNENFEERRTYFSSSLDDYFNDVKNIITSYRQNNWMSLQDGVGGVVDSSISFDDQSLFFEL